MAKSKTAASGPNVSSLARNLISSIGLQTMKTLLERTWPDLAVNQVNNTTLRMRCPMPWHADTTPSFNWDFTDGHAHCYGCKYHTFDLIRFLKDAKGMSPKEVVELLRGYTNARIFSETATKELDARAVHTEATRFIMLACNRFMVRCIARPPGDPDYSESLQRAVAPTLDWLFGERRHLQDQAAFMPYGLMPPLEMLNKLVIEVIDEDLAFRMANKQSYPEKDWREKIHTRIKEILKDMDISWAYSVTWHTGYGLTEPGRIRLRRPNSDRKDMQILPGFGENPSVGFFGLYNPTFQAFNSRDAGKLRLFVVEGENDCLTLAERYRESGMSGVLFVAGCGGAVQLDELHDAGFYEVHIISDEPSPDFGKGEAFIKQCLNEARKIKPSVFIAWDTVRANNPSIKDPDNAVAVLGFRPFYDIACDPTTFRVNYADPMEWAINQVEMIRQEKGLDDIQRMVSLASEYGQLLKNPSLQAAYIDAISLRFGLPSGPLRQDIAQRQDNAESFRIRITNQMLREYHPLYITTSHRGHVMTLWNRHKKTQVNFPMHDGEAIAKTFVRANGNYYNYIKNVIGIPKFMSAGEEGDSLRAVEPEIYYCKKLYDYAKLAAEDLMKDLPEKSDCEWYSQGTHRLPDPDKGGSFAYYVVNGRAVYKGAIPHVAANHIEWKELDGPADGHYLFRLDARPWSKEITDVNDLIQGNHVTKDQLKAAVATVEQALSHWVFARQAADTVFLARHLVAMAAPFSFSAKVIISLLGDTSSGKSTLMAIFAGGKAKSLQLLEASRLKENYTAASVYQEWDASNLAMCLDEFEDEGGNDSASKAVTAIQKDLRNVINEGGGSVSRGSANSEDGVKNYRLQSFVMFASILKARKEQDENRRYDVDLRKQVGLVRPDTAVFQDISYDEYVKIRRLLSIGVYRYGDEFRKNAEEIQKELNTTKFFSINVPSRFADCLVPAAAVMATLGEDWRAFIRSVCEQHREKFMAQTNNTASANLLDRLVFTPGIKLPTAARSETRCVDIIGSGEEDIALLNASGCGLYYMHDAKILVVNWITARAKGGLIDKSGDYQGQTARNLKHVFDQNPKAIRAEDVERLGIHKFVQSQGDFWRQDLFSAYDATDLAAELSKNKTATSAQNGSAPTAASEPKQHGSGNLD